VKGHENENEAFQAPEKLNSTSCVKGHDFSRADKANKMTGALAPAKASSNASLNSTSCVKGHENENEAFQAPEKLNSTSCVKGHDFSRAEDHDNGNGALAPEAAENIVFHDPCYLGRYRNVYEEPRAIVSAAGQLLESPRNHERSFCCGAGGGLAFLGEETGERVSHVRASELVATGAATIATACPFCNTMFRDALAETGEAAPKLMDIAQLVARGLPKLP
jgi:hypothetical protein